MDWFLVWEKSVIFLFEFFVKIKIICERKYDEKMSLF